VENERRRIFILNIYLEKYIIDNIMSVPMNLHEFMGSYDAKITQNAINSFEQQFLVLPDGILRQKV